MRFPSLMLLTQTMTAAFGALKDLDDEVTELEALDLCELGNALLTHYRSHVDDDDWLRVTALIRGWSQ